MTERGFGIKADPTKSAWESEDFPQLCETCLGDNPYIRMMKESFGQACKICERPFTVFRWKPGKRTRYKKTEICQTCARLKNVCQTCVLDLAYNLPVQVRDAFLASENGQALMAVPESEANREWFAQQHNRMLEQEGKVSAYDTMSGTNGTLVQLARKEPHYARNRPHLCSFFARGECTRGEECPYLHELPKDKNDPLSHQNIRDRFHGQNDPVAQSMLNRQIRKISTNNDVTEPTRKKSKKPPPPPLPPPSPPKDSSTISIPKPPPPISPMEPLSVEK
ncbi:hypothetical protein ABG067_002471 [Albugo candida]